jgi:hypothetical protein
MVDLLSIALGVNDGLSPEEFYANLLLRKKLEVGVSGEWADLGEGFANSVVEE